MVSKAALKVTVYSTTLYFFTYTNNTKYKNGGYPFKRVSLYFFLTGRSQP
jgi:hypothetical protein